jgi:hypothetical protein
MVVLLVSGVICICVYVRYQFVVVWRGSGSDVLRSSLSYSMIKDVSTANAFLVSDLIFDVVPVIASA